MVRYGETSVVLTGKNLSQPITGLSVGSQYRLKVSTWTPDTASVLIDDVDTGMFASITANSWVDDTLLFTADNEDIIISFVGSENTSYYDGFYLQEYTSEIKKLTPIEIIENKNPSDILKDNTVYPDPNYIEWGSINLFPDPDMEEGNDSLWETFVNSGTDTVTVTTELSEDYVSSGTTSRKTI